MSAAAGDLGSNELAASPVGRLALAFQEAFVVVIRLRDGRAAAANSESFRRQVKQLLASADAEARAAGYHKDIVRLAVYAYIAFLDESVLNSPQGVFGDWPRRPLQEEIFGDLRAGETFYRNLHDLLSSPNSEATADVLEVYLLCLLLGFYGRYGSSESGERQALIAQCYDKIVQVRGAPGELSPSWRPPPDEEVPELRDQWVRRLGIMAAGFTGLALACFVVFWIVLGSGSAEIIELATGVVG